MIGKYLLDLKDYSHQNDAALLRMQQDIDSRTTKVEFISTMRAKTKKLKKKLSSGMERQDEKQTEMEQKYDR